jgi:hypothetical protein
LVNRYKLRQTDKKKLMGFLGMLQHRRRIPFAGFIPNVLDNILPVDEFKVGLIPLVGIVDSNVLSADISLPVPGNDDSMICINYYCYMLTRVIFAGKINSALIWNDNIYGKLRINLNFTTFVKLYVNVYKNYDQNSFFSILTNVDPISLRHAIPINKAILHNSFLEDVYVGCYGKFNKINMVDFIGNIELF